MSRIVKSVAVVDDRSEAPGQNAGKEHLLTGKPVIKGWTLNSSVKSGPPTDVFGFAPKDAFLDEMNRLKVQIEQSKEELRRVKSEIGEAYELAEKAKEQHALAAELEDDNVYEARRLEIQDMLETVERETQNLRGEAEAEAKQIKQQAQNEGYLEGFNKGYEEAVTEYRKENQPKAEQLADMVERLSSFEQDRLKKNEDELVDLAVAIASKIVSREIKEDPKTVRDMLRQAVNDNHREEYIKITLAEDLLPAEARASEKMISMLEDMGANISVYTDKEAALGTCILETPKGIVDMSMQTQLDNIKRAMTGEP